MKRSFANPRVEPVCDGVSSVRQVDRGARDPSIGKVGLSCRAANGQQTSEHGPWRTAGLRLAEAEKPQQIDRLRGDRREPS